MGLGPPRSFAVPNPGVAQIISSIVSTEEYYFLDRSIISHLGGRVPRRRDRSGHSRPSNSVECPGVVQIARAIESAKHHYLRTSGVVRHRQVRACRRRSRRGKPHPTFGAPAKGSRARGDRYDNAAPEDGEKPMLPSSSVASRHSVRTSFAARPSEKSPNSFCFIGRELNCRIRMLSNRRLRTERIRHKTLDDPGQSFLTARKICSKISRSPKRNFHCG